MTGFWASYSNLLFHFGFQRALCGRPFEARVVFIFHLYSNCFVKVHLEARGIKALKKQMSWPQNDGLLFLLFKSIVSLWASNGLLFVEDHLKPLLFLIFHLYSNSFVKARLEARDIKALKKQMVWLQNDGLLGFLFKSVVSRWAFNGLPFVEDHLKPVLFLFLTFTATLL